MAVSNPLFPQAEADEFVRCSVCSRTPLVGEGVTVLRRGRREAMVCDLCLAKPRAGALGEPVGRDRIRSAAGAATVRIATPVAKRRAKRAPQSPRISLRQGV
jgi:hypothetical protein